jgi:hypothetical protein
MGAMEPIVGINYKTPGVSGFTDIEEKKSARVSDINGFIEIKGNPISKVGVFPYSGSQISKDLDPGKIYNVYRPEEELNNEATIISFKLLPMTIRHAMLGSSKEGLTPAEEKGVEGVIGQDVYFEYPYLKSNLKIFSETAKDIIDSSFNELSIGYRCTYDIQSGEFEGQKYDVIQRNIRGNHIAVVEEGRSGPDVSVLDQMTFTFDAKELKVEACKDEDFDFKEALAELKSRIEKVEMMLAEKSQDTETEEEEDGEPETMIAKTSGMDAKEVFKELARRDDLAKKISLHIGAFDHSEKTLSEVAEYGVKKLGLKCNKGHEEAVLSGFFAASKKSPVISARAEDRAEEMSLTEFLKGVL